MTQNQWRQQWGGQRWRLTPLGIEVEHKGFLRTAGHPKTVIQIWDDYGELILHASYQTGAPVDMIVAMIPIEARRLSNGSFDPRSDRKEPGYTSDEVTPHRRSPGLMQTLITTARRMAVDFSFFPAEEVDTEMLFDPYYSLLLGAAYIKHQIDRYGEDPVLICGAYNAGSVKKSDENTWHIRTHGPTRMDRYVAWFNDFHAAIRQGDIVVPKDTIFTSEVR